MAAARACDQTAKAAMSTCETQINTAVKDCLTKLSEANRVGVAKSELKIKRDSYLACKVKANSEGKACLQKVDKASAECKAKEVVAANSEQEADNKKQGAEVEKIDAGVEKKVAAEQKAEAIGLKEQGQQLVAEGNAALNYDPAVANEKINGGRNYTAIGQQKEFAADVMKSNAVAKESQAIAQEREADQQKNEAMLAATIIAQNIAQLAAARQKAQDQLAQLERGVDAAVGQVDEINKASGGDQSGDNTTEIARKPKPDSSGQVNPAGTKGQGADPSAASNSQAQNQKKSDDQAGAGGGSGGSGGGAGGAPSSGSSSSPLKVSEGPKDCSNPSVAASNPVCACRLNPSDSRCNSILAADRERREGPAKKPKVIDGEEGGGGGGSSFNGTGPKSAAQKAAISQHGQLEQNGGGSSGKGVGSGMGGSAAGSSKNDSKVNLRDQKPIAGPGGRSYGGGGGGGSGSAGNLAGAPNRKIPNTFAASGNSMGRNPASITRAPSAAELRAQAQNQFNALRRGPSGSGSMIGVDGISGPHTDQFKKIRVRYADAFGL